MTTPTPAQGLFDVPAAARWLDVSEATVWRLLRSQELPALRVGRSTRVSIADLEAYVERLREKAGAA